MRKKILLYPEESMAQALQAVKNGVSISAASKQFNVPRTTLYYKHTGKYPEKRQMGPTTYLTPKEENGLVKWLLHMSTNGFPINKEYLLDSVQLIVKQLNKETPFVDGRPGRHWYELFLKRHPEVSVRISQNLTTSRANVTEQNIRLWFQEVEKYLQDNNYLDITRDQMRVFNTDETAFFLSPKGGKVLAKKGEKTIYNRISTNEKECLTTLITGNAAGLLAPPMVVFSYERLPASIAASVPKSWAIGKTESGWMTGETFFMYISNTFHSWLLQNQIQRPVILFVDGHASHLTLPLSEFCNNNGIILVALYPNATHILQPMDVAIFHPLKNSWKNVVTKWRIGHNAEKLRKENFSPLLQEALDKTITKNMLANGFRTCGLCPFDSNAIDYKKFMKNSKNNNSGTDQVKIIEEDVRNKDFVEELNERIGRDKVILFQSSGCIWEGNMEDTSLFYIWRDVNKIEVVDRNDHLTKATTTEALPVEIELIDQFEISNDILGTDSILKEKQSYISDIPESPNKDYAFEAPWLMDLFDDDNNEGKTAGLELKEKDTNISSVGKMTGREKSFKKLHIISDIKLNSFKENTTIISSCQNLNGNSPSPQDNKENILNLTNIKIPNKQTQNNEKTPPKKELENTLNTATTEIFTKQKQINEATPPKNVEQNVLNITTLEEHLDETKINELTPPKIKNDKENEVLNNNTMEKYPQTQIKNIPDGVPTPFKTLLFWPEIPKSENKKKVKVKLPSVASSEQWQDYYKRSAEKKEVLQNEKLERKRKREEKAQEKNSKKKIAGNKVLSKTGAMNGCSSKQATEKHIDENGNNNKQSNKIETDSYVIVIYEGAYYPGKVLDVCPDKIHITVMERSGICGWRWPSQPDTLWYERKEVIKNISAPKKINNRGVFIVEEMEEFEDFTK